MPWTATFVADYTQLDQALGSIETKLGRVEQDADKLKKSLQKVTSEFDGSKVTQQAQTMAEAIARVGKVTNLTEAEQRKVNATITEAMAKYKALGTTAPAAIQRLSNELQEAAAKTKALGTAATQTGSMFGGIKTAAIGAFAGFSAAGIMAGAISGLKNVATGALDTAGMLSDLSAQTGIQASALDRMRLAASPAGVELEKITTTIAMMSDKLVSGDTGAVSAVNRLGLSLNTLKASKPDAAFISILEGLAKIPDPMERTKVAFDLFGGKAKEILRLVNAEFIENAKTGQGWSEDQINALDNAGDAWDRFQKDVETATGKAIASVYAFVESLSVGGSAWSMFMNTPLSGLGNIGRQIAVGKTIPGMRHSGDLALGEDASGAAIDGVTDFAKALEEYDKQARKAAEASGLLLNQRGWDAHVRQLQAETKAYLELSVMTWAAAQGLDSVRRARAGVTGTITGGRDISAITGAVSAFGFVPTSNQNTVGNYASGGGVNWAGVPAQLLGAFSGGNIGAGLGSVGGGIGGTALASAFGATTGSVLGSVAPIIGTMVGGIVGKWLGGMFGPSKNAIATQEANARIGTTQQGLLGEYGSVEAISNMGPAGNALAAAWGSKGTQGEAWFNKLYAEFTAQVQRQNEALGEQATKQQQLLSLEEQRTALVESLVPNWDTVNGLLEKYGISLESTGQQVQQLGTTQWFTALINDMDTMQRAGIDVGGMLMGMADEISGVVQQSVRFGTEIPENMRPYIAELIRAGLLVDANGDKVTDLAGIQWGAPVETQAEIVTAAIDVMTEAITTLKNELQALADFLATVLPRAAQQGADGIEDAFRGTTIDVDTRGDGDVSTKRAAGAVVTRPERAWIGEGGQPEIVGPVDFMARALYGAMARAGMGGMGGSPIVVDSRIDLNGREVGRQMITIIPEAARRAGVRLAPA